MALPVVVFNVIGIKAWFSGYFYLRDEEIIKNFPHSMEAKRIEYERRHHTYDVYIPKKYRADYERRYYPKNK